jgi:large subunit ribosomal protein L5
MKQEALKTKYMSVIRQKLSEQLGFKNPHQIPVLEKITINMGVGKAVQDKKFIEKAVADMELIAGQKPIVTYVKNSEAGFKIRSGWPIGVKVTLRGLKMYNFLERLLYISLPLARDFRGLNPKSFDGRGNYSFGIKDQSIFREIPYDQIDAVRGMDIAVTTSAQSDTEARALLHELGFPFVGAHQQKDQE